MKDYLSKEKTTAVKGIFVILIVFSHASQYMSLKGIYDETYMILKNHLNQMVVAMFLFYSGYGMMVSVLKKGFDYVKTIPVKRFLRVLLNFDIAVMIFWITGLCLGKTYPVRQVLLSLTGWKSVGNSNWYMFAIFALYVFSFIAFLVYRWSDGKYTGYFSAGILTILTIGFVYLEMKAGQPMYCYDTVILFPFGCWYALLQKKIEAVVMKNDFLFAAAALLTGAVYMVSYLHRWEYGIEGYTVWAVTFTFAVVLLTMKISFSNPVLQWFGEHIFSVYILQRLPMIVLDHFGIADTHKYMFLITTLLVTVCIAPVFDMFMDRLSRLIFNRKEGC